MGEDRGTVRRAIGLISGTSMDGVDVALLDTDGRSHVVAGPTGFQPYAADDRALLRDALGVAARLTDRSARPGLLVEAERLVTDRHAAAVERFLADEGIDPGSVDLVGFHGQTVLHRPDQALTVQIGDGAAMARRLGIDVVADLRAADMAAGGQGAPLVPVYHRALALASGLALPAVLLNVGGVSNITFLPATGDPLACDTGPGNALLDDLMLERTGEPIDRDGAMAASGRVDERALARLLDHPFFALPAPKSLDRNAFSRAPVDGLGTADAAATLVAFTADSVASMFRYLPAPPARRGGVRRRRPQPGAGGGPGRSAALSRDGGGPARLGRRRHRGSGLCLPRGALARRPAAHLPDDDRMPGADDGRRPAPGALKRAGVRSARCGSGWRCVPGCRAACRDRRRRRRSACRRSSRRSGWRPG